MAFALENSSREAIHTATSQDSERLRLYEYLSAPLNPDVDGPSMSMSSKA